MGELRFVLVPQVSSGEASAATLRLEEMTTALETQQREVTSLRAFARETTSTRKRHHQQQQQEKDPREMDKREKNRCDVNSPNNGCVSGRSSVLIEGDGNTLVAPNATVVSETHEVKFAPGRGAAVPDARKTAGSPAEEASAVVHARKLHPSGYPTGDPVRKMTVNEAVEDSKGDDQMGDIKDNRKYDPKDNEPPRESHCCDDAEERPRCPKTQKTRLRSEDSDRGESPTEIPPLGEAPSPKRGNEIVSSAEGETSYEEQQAKEDRQGMGKGGVRTKRAVIDVEAEAELLERMRLCEQEKRGWEKEAVCLRVERQEMLQRLRKLAQEAHEKVGQVRFFCWIFFSTGHNRANLSRWLAVKEAE